ncbi:GNAT family N-acetyltransferase [Candidatus Roizmanbacteria bacterium]|nr:GNAT family N-acetyltransferase [Candidatus Roizmanbacteria bacterium]
MIKISKATSKEALIEEWHRVDVPHYGKRIDWKEKEFRLKAVERRKIVGTVEGKHGSGVIYIDSLITVERARGKGIGTMLIKKAEEFGKKLGAHRTWLITGKDWSENIFYKKLGFVLVGTLPDFHFHKDFVVYTREIK